MAAANNLLADIEGPSAIDTCGTLGKCQSSGYCGYKAAEGYSEQGQTDCYFNPNNQNDPTNQKCYMLT